MGSPPVSHRLFPASGVSQPVPPEARPLAEGTYLCSYAPKEPMTLQVWLSGNETHNPEAPGVGPPALQRSGLPFDYKMEPVVASLPVRMSPELVSGNASLFMHAYLRWAGRRCPH